VPLTRSDCFRVLTCPSVCALQEVSALRSLGLFRVLTYPPVCALQLVSASRSLRLFLYPNLSLRLRSPASESPSLTRIVCVSRLVPPSALSSWWAPFARSDCYRVLTCSSVCALQSVSAPRSLQLFPCPEGALCLRSPASEYPSLTWIVPCPDLSLSLRSPESECPLLARIVSVSNLSLRLRSPESE
jgi:hypothetical protein